METSALLKAFCASVEGRDGKAFADLFTEDGVYHDVFYGDFKGRVRIAEMIDDWFYRTAHEFRWEMHRPVSDGRMLYAYYTFSYVSKLPEAKGKRVGFEGVSMMTLKDGKIADYRELANVGPAFVELAATPDQAAHGPVPAIGGRPLRPSPRAPCCGAWHPPAAARWSSAPASWASRRPGRWRAPGMARSPSSTRTQCPIPAAPPATTTG